MKSVLIVLIHILLVFHQPSNCQKSPQTILCRPNDEIILMDNNDLETINESDPKIDTENVFCDCLATESEPWGLQTLTINCQEKKFQNNLFDIDNLPIFTESLDLSWNHFEFVPKLNGNELIHLDISHNIITAIDDNNFETISNLQTLILRSNKITMLSPNSFLGLLKLKKLDLSHNKLTKLTGLVFSTLPKLSELILSHNRYINETFSRPDVDLYIVLGVTTQLESLQIEYSNLNAIDIMHGDALRELHLKGNNFIQPPNMTSNIEYIDLSQNPIEIIGPKFLSHIFNVNLHTLYLTDMPKLKSIQDYGLYGLPNLLELNLQGSWNLKEFSGIAFGPVNTTSKLEILNLRGTPLRMLNSSLAVALQNLKSLDLNGNPMICDCNSQWILNLNLETNAKCVKPSGLRGRLLSNIRSEELKCKRWPSWVYTLVNGLLIMVMLIICALLTWAIVLGVKPLRHSKLLHKVGEASPYARITIEPNQAELRR